MKLFHLSNREAIAKLAAVICVAMLSACASYEIENNPEPAVSESSAQMSAQLIIRFSDRLTLSQASEKMAQFGRQYMVDFNVVREMEPGLFVISANSIAGERHLSALMSSVQQRADVKYVERDAILSHQPNRSSGSFTKQ